MPYSPAFFATMEGRHLVLAYATVLLFQGGYATWLAVQWRKLSKTRQPGL